MFKKLRSLEKRFYEIIGIKRFRKMAFVSRDLFFSFLGLNKEERNDMLYSKDNESNYTINGGLSIENIKDFKRMLRFNAIIHSLALIACFPAMRYIIMGQVTPLALIAIMPPFLVNLYCVLLQRYNHIRINEVIEKHQKYEALKAKRKKRKEKELRQEYASVLSLLEEFNKRHSSLNNLVNDSKKVVASRKFNIPNVKVPKTSDIICFQGNQKSLVRKVG